jgi:hypothetical protein
MLKSLNATSYGDKMESRLKLPATGAACQFSPSEVLTMAVSYYVRRRTVESGSKALTQRCRFSPERWRPCAHSRFSDAVPFDLLAKWVADETTRRRILVENPATLYGFSR